MSDYPYIPIDGFEMPGGQFVRRDRDGRMLFGDADVAQATLEELLNGIPGGGASWTVTTKTGPTSYTAAFGDLILCDTTGGTVTVALPTAVGNEGKEISVKRLVEAGTLTVNTTSSQTIDGDTTISMIGQYESLTFVSDGSNWVIT